jgi:hypothetical protein
MKLRKIIFFLAMVALLILSACENKAEKKMQTDAKMQLERTALKINKDFEAVRKEVKKLADYIERLYDDAEQEKNLKNVDKEKYQLHPSGIFYKLQDDGKSAVFVSAQSAGDPGVQKIVYFTEPMEDEFIRIVKQFPEIVQPYYNDRHSYNRIYPFMDVVAQYPDTMMIPDYNFYFLADEKHNPGKKAVWVDEPYVDPAGRGWMVSAIAPVYVNDRLEGVPGLDVTINTITQRYIKDEKQNLMILDKTGVVVSTNDFLTGLFLLPPLKNHKYLETIKQDTYKSDDYNLLKSKTRNVRELAEKIYKEDIRSMEFQQTGDSKFLVLIENIPELKWKILKVLRK